MLKFCCSNYKVATKYKRQIIPGVVQILEAKEMLPLQQKEFKLDNNFFPVITENSGYIEHHGT